MNPSISFAIFLSGMKTRLDVVRLLNVAHRMNVFSVYTLHRSSIRSFLYLIE